MKRRTFLRSLSVSCMPIHNKFFLRKKPDGTVDFHPGPLHVQGPILPIEVHVPSILAAYFSERNETPPAPVAGLALIDTGATNSCVDNKVIASLGVKPVGIIKTGTAGGVVEQHVYPAKFRFPVEGMEVEFNRAVGVDLTGQTVAGHDIIALIGRDLLTRWVLIYNGPGGFFTLAI